MHDRILETVSIRDWTEFSGNSEVGNLFFTANKILQGLYIMM